MEIHLIWTSTSILVAFSSLTISIEWYLFYNIRKYDSYQWEIIRLNSIVSQNWILDCFNFFDYKKMKILIFLMIVISLLFGFLCFTTYNTILSTLLLICTLILHLKHPYGMDGADQIRACALCAICIGNIYPSILVKQIAILFISSQLIASYFFAGFHKFRSTAWRSGRAIIEIFSTKLYGHHTLYLFFKSHQKVVFYISWVVILFETLFLFILFFPRNALLIYISIAISFHIFNMLFMGLGSFFHSFLTAYPSIVYTNYLFKSTIMTNSYLQFLLTSNLFKNFSIVFHLKLNFYFTLHNIPIEQISYYS